MDCDRFIELANNWNKEVCIFGAGDCGSTWGYEIIKEAGFSISFYIDNNKRGQACNGLPVYPPEYLNRFDSSEVLCIVSIVGDRGREVLEQLQTMDFKEYFWLHDGDDFRLELPQYLDEKGDEELIRRFHSLMSDKEYLITRFRERMGYTLDFEQPKTFNEKLQWLKLYDRKPIYTTMVDKASVKEYVAKLIGEQYIIPTLGVYDSFDEIDFDRLPERFVLKCTHDSGSIVICKNKTGFDFESARTKLENARRKNYYWPDREWPYYGVPRRIIVEEFIESSRSVLEVYKIFNFSGIPRIIQVIQNDKTSYETIDYYDCDWNLLSIRQNFPNSKEQIAKPKNLDELLILARKLSTGFPFLRTDFYVVNGKALFSEFTFFTDSGCEPFHPERWDRELGELIILPRNPAALKSDVCDLEHL